VHEEPLFIGLKTVSKAMLLDCLGRLHVMSSRLQIEEEQQGEKRKRYKRPPQIAMLCSFHAACNAVRITLSIPFCHLHPTRLLPSSIKVWSLEIVADSSTFPAL
jgi:hypothetical protein